ncbi:MAG: response regulator [Candidatus Omnitrophica bacterium]|nr:response regulator [Candidatus Omnitrophota bacterium]
MTKKPIKVLLVEDTPEDARLMQEALAQETESAFEVHHADRLAQAVTFLSAEEFDLVLLDLILPDSEGLDTLIKLRDRASRVPIVILTASDDDTLAINALQRGAQDYLVKGYVQVYPALLSRAMRYAIERKRGERMKDEFVSTVSHELRTPLATIREFAAILSDQIAGPLTPDQRQYLGIIQNNVDRLTRMIDNLLDMAKIEAGQVLLGKVVVEARPFLDHVIETIRPLAANKQLELAVELESESLQLFADADKITQVLLNLLSNAIKFTPNGGRITVGIAEQPNEIEFSVTDTGIGIAAADFPKLFEKFQQVQPLVGEATAKGTGLGLAISKRLVELHGGRIWAKSAKDQGSAFSFTLPKYQPEELFHEYFKGGIDSAKRRQGRFSIIVVSVVGFPEIKALYGLEETSHLLKELETALREMVRKRAGDIVVRWRRGEMVVILAEVDQAGAQAMAERISRSLNERTFTVPSAGQGVTIPVTTTTATYPEDGSTEEELLTLIQSRLHQTETSKTRIMIVDDEAKIRQFLKEVLELREYEVLTAASGPDALEQLRRHRVDLVLLDIMMPVMDGYEVYHLLKENPRTRAVPVIIVTAKGERKDRQLGMDSPTYNHLVKPFQIEELLAKVRDVLQHQSVHS